MLKDREAFEFESAGQRWRTSWHLGDAAPEGKRHGSAGICVTADQHLVLITQDRHTWDFPAGRPEGEETWEQTLRREVREEACATVDAVRLLGFSRGECLQGHERGLILVRAIWLAHVTLLPWEPAFEIVERRLMPASNALALLPHHFQRFWQAAFAEAGIVY